MDSLLVKVDSTLSHYTGSREMWVDVDGLEQPVTVRTVLEYLHVPLGMVGPVLGGKKLLHQSYPLNSIRELKLFGIYSGG